jgi:DNA-binding response OmpR family regulator
VFNLFLQQQVPRYRSRTRLQAGPIRIDEAGDVWINGYLIAPPLTKKEQALLAYLCVEPGRLTTKDEIVAVVYPEQYQLGETVSDEALNVLVRRLRERVDPLADGKCRIATIRGKGYRLEVG